MFLIFVNDLLDEVQSSGKMFADDTKLYRRIKEPNDRAILQKDLDKLHEWSNRWLLHFNKKKCKVMHIGRSNTGHQYHLGSTNLTESNKEKDLGSPGNPRLEAHCPGSKGSSICQLCAGED